MEGRRLISFFLIAFGLFGYALCVPFVYYSHSVLLLFSSSLDELDENLIDIKSTMREAETDLDSYISSLDDVITAVSYLDFSSIDETINTTIDSTENMLNEAGDTLDEAENMINDTADWLELFSNDPLMITIVPEVAAEAGELVTTTRSITENLSEISTSSTAAAEGLSNLQTSLSLLLTLVEGSTSELTTTLQTFQADLRNLKNYMGDIETSIDDWTPKIQGFQEKTWLVNLGIYVFIIYLICLHTALLLIGWILRGGLNTDHPTVNQSPPN